MAAEEGDATIVPERWRRVAVLTAGPGTRVTEELDAYEVSDAYWLCPARWAR